MSETSDLLQLSIRLGRSLSWTQKNWRTITGLPAPFIGFHKGQRPLWRTADLNRFFSGSALPTAANLNPFHRPQTAPPQLPRRDDEGNPAGARSHSFDARRTALLTAAGA